MPPYVAPRTRKYRYRQFAAKYIETGCNGLQSAIQCGFTDNPNSAKTIASRLLTYVYVQDRIKEHMDKVDLTAQEVIDELAKVVRSDVKVGPSEKMKALEMAGKHFKLFDRAGEEPRSESNLLNAKDIYISSMKGKVSEEQAGKFWDEQMAQLEAKSSVNDDIQAESESIS